MALLGLSSYFIDLFLTWENNWEAQLSSYKSLILTFIIRISLALAVFYSQTWKVSFSMTGNSKCSLQNVYYSSLQNFVLSLPRFSLMTYYLGKRVVTISTDTALISVCHHWAMRLLSKLFSKLSAFLHLPFSRWLIKYEMIREMHFHWSEDISF